MCHTVILSYFSLQEERQSQTCFLSSFLSPTVLCALLASPLGFSTVLSSIEQGHASQVLPEHTSQSSVIIPQNLNNGRRDLY